MPLILMKLFLRKNFDMDKKSIKVQFSIVKVRINRLLLVQSYYSTL